jgi:hypothetical protein
MKSLLKNLGPILLLIGTGVLGVYFFNTTPENTLLIVALILMVVGMLAHIIINKFVED